LESLKTRGLTMQLEYPGSKTLAISKDTPPGSQPLIRPEAIIKADSLAYLIWDVANIDKQETFLHDFGMLTYKKNATDIYMRGYGSSPYLYYGRKAKKSAFVGIGFNVNNHKDLVTLSKKTGQRIEKIQRLGGGEMVSLMDPSGITVEVCFGIEKVNKIDTRRTALQANNSDNVTRINSGQRAPLMPSPVLKLGHCVLGTNLFEDTAHWYMRHLGLIPTDALCLEDGSPTVTFMRFDRGDNPSDHHAIVVGKGGGEGYLHSAYEVVDVDAVAQGQQFLKMTKKYKHFWGIGRHILGSQVFDYWNAPDGFEFEHYSDGDVYTSSHPTEYHPLDTGNIYAWGHDLPKAMFALKPAQVWGIVRGIIKGDVSFTWLKQAKKAVSRPARPWL
jgi:catechol 2,3-dioxygenase-like lactoylglutathione lyase family enzyme